MKSPWRTGVLFTAAQFLTLAIGFGFQVVVGNEVKGQPGEFGYFQAAIIFIGFLGLPVSIAAQAVTHYIPRLHFASDSERLHGLLAGCRKFLLHITLAGSVTAILLVHPLGHFFHIPRASLTMIALFCALAGLWSSFITAICQGLGWFKQLALIALFAAVIRFAFGASMTWFRPVAESAVSASGVMLLAYVALLYWRKDFPRRTDQPVSPWTTEFVQFLVVSAACVVGNNCFTQYDGLVAERYFSRDALDNYGAAGMLARQIPSLVGPLLTVLFTHRSGRHHGDALTEQLKLLGLFGVGLVINAVGLFILKGIGLWLVRKHTPEAAAMIGPFCITMVFSGLLQALGTWALASRWIKISLLYGGLGLAYLVTLLVFGTAPDRLLHLMPIATGIAFAILFLVWLIAMRLHKIEVSEET